MTTTWTCPDCRREVTVTGTKQDADVAMRACQDRHGRAHRAAATARAHPEVRRRTA